MATVEIDEAELVNLQKISGAVQKMLQNPTSRRKILEAQKDINPNAVIPELDAAKPLNEALSGMTKKVDELAKSIADDKEERKAAEERAKLESRWESGRSVAKKAGYTAEGLEALEKFMIEKGIADHDLAMPAFERLNPPSAPVSASTSGFDLLQQSVASTNEEMKRLMETRGLDASATSSLVQKALSDIRTRQ